MDMSRRAFLACTAAAAMPQRFRLPSSPAASPSLRCLVLPVPGECSIPESVKGYCAALPATRWVRRETWIVPAVLDIPSHIAAMIGAALRRGTTVIVESGGGFAGRSSFRQHRRALRDGLQIDVDAPVDLWARCGSRRTPYVDYTWLHPAKIRDFSRVVPIGDQPGEIIAWVDGLPVALKRQVGAGTLIFLGSPLGPALWAGDAEARSWLLSLAAVPSAGTRA